jgi:hypothetical protein
MISEKNEKTERSINQTETFDSQITPKKKKKATKPKTNRGVGTRSPYTIPIDGKMMLEETLKSLEQDQLTPELERIFIALGKNIIRKKGKDFKSKDDMMDCLQEGYNALFTRWRSFDINISNNAFAYYTEIFKRGMARGFNEITNRKKKYECNGYVSIERGNEGEGLFSF